ncbi:MAG: hypothetical protein GY950_36025, partial [bacterium]|nr:hypothetical protein [bacterium]
SITEFWRRWHISLATWLRDYLFLPIAYGISRKIKQEKLLTVKAESWAYIIGISVTMLLCGLWHGAKWTFVLWGGLHGLYLVLSFVTRKTRKKWRKKIITPLGPGVTHAYKGIRILVTFSLISFMWIFFRANSLPDAFYIVSHLFSAGGTAPSPFSPVGLELTTALAAAGFILFIHLVQPHSGIRRMFDGNPLLLRWLLYVILVLTIMNLGRFEDVPFIYEQF